MRQSVHTQAQCGDNTRQSVHTQAQCSSTSDSEWHDECSSISSSEMDEILMKVPHKEIFRRKRRRAAHRKNNQEGVVKRKTRRGGGPPKAPPEVSALLGRAHVLYISRDYCEAVRLLEEVVRHAPGLPDPFHTLGLIYEELGDTGKSLEFLLVAAHLQVRDSALWRRVADLSREKGLYKQAIYCYRRCLRNSPVLDDECMWELGRCYLKREQFTHAIKVYTELFELKSGCVDVGKELARSLHRVGKSHDAALVLEQCLPPDDKFTCNLDLNNVNMLCELYIERRDYQQCYNILKQVCVCVYGGVETDMCADLMVKMAVVEINLGMESDAMAIVREALTWDVSQNSDFLIILADTFHFRHKHTHTHTHTHTNIL
eukprot:GHVR01009959.1.p1 GENE.GHVR01009959.1~~GHVR01009959.1.p1  ORF type:complete len:373 (-),score=106.41 GHVR01009959.1:13-1131(-)